jgi:hypothetical protein
MGIPIRCPRCDRSYRLKDALGGKVVLCECGAKLRVPERKAGAAPRAEPSASSSAELPVATRVCPRCLRSMPHDPRIRACIECGFDLDEAEGGGPPGGPHPGAGGAGYKTAAGFLRENSLLIWLLVNVIAAWVLISLVTRGLLPEPGSSWTVGTTFALYMVPFCGLSYWLIARLLR